ncbi:MAG: hypothetical protein L6Q54_00595 [Leptospiraceae bacterium]|nr:hypothetical protein [Leptospiraceae bacterium]NUM41680.1 hypothetical protein [Leptospiraceae bacterium]
MGIIEQGMNKLREKTNKEKTNDFEGVINSPYSFFKYTLSVSIQKLGLAAYKKIKIKNAKKKYS